MKILYVVHYYLPRHQAGTEIYTHSLAKKFSEKGHEVWIFTSEDRSQPGFELKEEEYKGIKVFRLYHSGVRDFRSTYLREDFDEIFDKVLDELKPELIHFQHLFRLSVGFVHKAKKRGIPCILTLADYWLICPAIIMLKPQYVPCPDPEQSSACISCPHSMSAMIPGGFPATIQKSIEYALGLAHKIKRTLPPKWVDWLRDKLGRKQKLEEKEKLLKERWQEMKKVVDALDLIISPSNFLKQMMVSSKMIPVKKIIHSDYGFELEGYVEKAVREKGRLVLGYIGTLVAHKGVHILLQAIKQIKSQELELRIYGALEDFPGYVRWLKKIAGADQRIKWMGRAEHSQVPKILSELDLLVVPSLWYENSPLIIHEAFLAKTPVLASNLGGMKELLEKGGGALFEPNNPKDLGQKIEHLLKNPEEITLLAERIPQVKDINHHYNELFEIYQSLLAKSKSTG